MALYVTTCCCFLFLHLVRLDLLEPLGLVVQPAQLLVLHTRQVLQDLRGFRLDLSLNVKRKGVDVVA